MLHAAPNRLTYEALPRTPHATSNKRAPKRTKNAPDELIAGALLLVRCEVYSSSNSSGWRRL